MRIYCTVDDVEAWTGEPAPENVAALIRSASSIIEHTTRNDLYDVTPAGLPSDDDVADAFRDATCAQVAALIAADLDPDAGIAADKAEIASSKVLSGSVTYDTAGRRAARRRVENIVTGSAYRILRNAGLASSAVHHG